MNIWTFSIILVAFPKSCEKLTVLPLLSQAQPGGVQTPSNFLTCQDASTFLWISDKLITIANLNISVDIGVNS